MSTSSAAAGPSSAPLIGAYFLGFVANALILVGLSQFWLQAIYGVVILVAVGADALIARRIQRLDRREPSPMTVARPLRRPRRIAGSLARWETLLLVVLIALIVIGSRLSPVFLTPRNFANLLAALMEVAIMALPMTLVIIAGEIDLSVESMAGLACAVLGLPVGGGRADLDRRPAGHRRGGPRRA